VAAGALINSVSVSVKTNVCSNIYHSVYSGINNPAIGSSMTKRTTVCSYMANRRRRPACSPNSRTLSQSRRNGIWA